MPPGGDEACTAILEGVQPVEGRFELLTGDPVLFDVQRAEDGLVEHPSLFLVTAQVERLGVLQEVQRHLDQACRPGEVFFGVLQARVQAATPCLEVAQLLAHLVAVDLRVAGQSEQVVLGDVHPVELLAELAVQQACRLLLLGDRLFQVGANLLNEDRREPHGGVVGFDCLLHTHHVDVWRVAVAGLVGDAEEVGVLGAVPVGGLLDDHAAVHTTAAAAVATQERAFEVVVVLAPSFLGY